MKKIKEALTFLKRVKVVVPFAEQLNEYFPAKHVIMRTAFDRFLDYIKASAALHQYQRQTQETGEIIAQPEDYEIAADIFRHLTKDGNLMPVTRDQQEILDIFETEFQRYSVEQLNAEVPMSDKWLRVQLDRLVELGLLQVMGIKREEDGKTIRMYCKMPIANKINLPSFKEICRNTTKPTIHTNTTLPTITTNTIPVETLQSVQTGVIVHSDMRMAPQELQKTAKKCWRCQTDLSKEEEQLTLNGRSYCSSCFNIMNYEVIK